MGFADQGGLRFTALTKVCRKAEVLERRGATLAGTGEMGEGQKEGAVIMENGLAEMHAQRPVLGLVTRLGGRLGGGSRDTKSEDLPLDVVPAPSADLAVLRR